jgi:pimeloyl-ACP methyl ester carboxylesterase
MHGSPAMFDLGDFRIGGLATGTGRRDRPIVVALHGGGHTSAYFDLPGYSLLGAAETNGFDAVALDRPAYGKSTDLQATESVFAQNAEILDRAIASLWLDRGQGHPGIVLVGHSIGGAIAMHIAARSPEWPLLGLALAGIHDRAPEQVRQAWNSVPTDRPVVLPIEQLRPLMFGPDQSFAEDALHQSSEITAPAPVAELLEVVDTWTVAAQAIAAEIKVPVDYVAAEFEQLWEIDERSVAAFAAYFVQAPWVTANIMRGVGHNVDHHRVGPAMHLRQLAFALECAERIRTQ